MVATNLGFELSNLGHQVHFIAYEPPFRLPKNKNIYFHQVKINEYTLFKYPDYTLPLAVEIEKVQKKYNLDIVHVHYAVPHATAALLAKRIMRQNNIRLPKIITTLHGTDITLLAKDPALFEIIKYSIERSDGVTAVSETLKRQTISILKTDKPIEIIHNFYTPPKVTKSRAIVRQSLQIKNDDIAAIHLSNLRPVKRIPDLLKAASLIHNPKFKLLILGGSDFSPFLPLVKKLRLKNKLVIRNNIKDIQNYINASDFGVFTSKDESFGMGILEVLSYQKPVVATKAGGLSEIIDKDQVAFFHKVGDIKSIAKSIKRLTEEQALRNEMGEKAKKIACELFCSSHIVPKYLDYYKKIISENPK